MTAVPQRREDQAQQEDKAACSFVGSTQTPHPPAPEVPGPPQAVCTSPQDPWSAALTRPLPKGAHSLGSRAPGHGPPETPTVLRTSGSRPGLAIQMSLLRKGLRGWALYPQHLRQGLARGGHPQQTLGE